MSVSNACQPQQNTEKSNVYSNDMIWRTNTERNKTAQDNQTYPLSPIATAIKL